MALADTARLIASLELQDKFSGPARRIEGSLGGLERSTGRLGRIGAEASRGVGAAVGNLQRIGLIAGGIIATQVAAGLQSIVRLESVQTQTEAVLASTRSIAGITATEVRDLAEAFEGVNAVIDDKVIQSGANLLLTFTNIRERAFEPALQAALDMNQALGGGEEGLQATIIQVGKALQDPIRGITALRRVGVNFTDAQREQIKALVEANDLYGAQEVILAELATEFGGSFARAGDTAAGKFAKVKDAVEDAQMALATAFLPVLVKVADKLQTFLADDEVLRRIEEFGGTLAEGLDDAVQFAGKIPWAAIGTSLEIAGRGARVIFDAFNSLPPWVQTAVITGWGLNKLTGGALGNIVGALGSGLIKGVLGMNAGVVNINAAVVNGGGGGLPAGGAARGGFVPGLGGLAGLITKGIVGAGAILLTIEAGKQTAEFVGAISEMSTDLGARIDAVPRRNGEEIGTSIQRVEAALAAATDGPLNSMVTTLSGVRGDLQAELRELLRLQEIASTRGATIDASIGAAAQADHRDTAIVAARIAAVETSIGTAAQADRTDAATATARLAAIHTSIGTAAAADHADTHSAAKAAAAVIDSSIGSAAQSDHADAVTFNARIDAARERIVGQVAASGAAQLARQDAIAGAVRTNTAVLGAKNFAPDIAVTTNVTSNVSISDVQRRITSQQIAQSISVGGGGFAV